MTTQISLKTIEEEVTAFLAHQLEPGAAKIEAVTASEELSDEGDNILIVNIKFAASEQPLDPEQLADIPFRVSQQLVAAGEQRFCHVRIHFAEKQALWGW
jgi:hypothetical protein